ncbi:MAG: DNA circularization N-terminal domain-containing protein [Candidatus Aminicenantes bacterium]|nr:DNA circularization N-terminal domain-containing protein [Candidatus Aminicenantes bacterium]
MNDLIQLKTANYKGVEFAIRDMPTTGGNRIIKFNYPGSDKQSIEVQGKLPRSFSITAVIPHENYFSERDELLRVLEDGERGTLVHPTFGAIENVINGEYGLSENITELGRAEVTIQFEIDDSVGIPTESGNLGEEVAEQSNQLNNDLEEDFGEEYEVSLTSTGNFADALDNIGQVSQAIADASKTYNAPAEDLATIAAEINTFNGAIGNQIQSPTVLASSINGLFQSLDNLQETAERAFAQMKAMFNFGDDDPIIQEDTVGRIERKKNRDATRTMMKTQALSYAYVNASLITYETSDDLDLIQNQLEDQYLSIRNNELISNRTLEQLDRLRVQALKALDSASVNTRSIITIETSRKPLSVLVYEYYGNTELFDTIAELNNIKQNSFVEGEIRILTS